MRVSARCSSEAARCCTERKKNCLRNSNLTIYGIFPVFLPLSNTFCLVLLIHWGFRAAHSPYSDSIWTAFFFVFQCQWSFFLNAMEPQNEAYEWVFVEIKKIHSSFRCWCRLIDWNWQHWLCFLLFIGIHCSVLFIIMRRDKISTCEIIHFSMEWNEFSSLSELFNFSVMLSYSPFDQKASPCS
jgi:hypothetical protein